MGHVITKPTQEDLVLLDLLVHKLEENHFRYGKEFFDHSVEESTINYITEGNEERCRNEGVDYSNCPNEVKRVKLMFHSKADFKSGRTLFDNSNPIVSQDDTLVASYLDIEWDYITGVFHVRVGLQEYEHDKNNNNVTKRMMRKSNYDDDDPVSSYTYIDFGFQYRREIQMIKVRLARLYKNIKRDKYEEEQAKFRRHLNSAANHAFPDLLDPLILGRT